MDPEDINLIRANAERFRVKNLVPVCGRAPEAWGNLPQPDCIFVGGSGREIARLVELAYKQLKPGGRLVANVGSIENLAAVYDVVATCQAGEVAGAHDQRRPRHVSIGTGPVRSIESDVLVECNEAEIVP